MDKFCIITNSTKDHGLIISHEIQDYLKDRKARCEIQLANDKKDGEYHYTNPDLIPADTQCIIVLGGDGTMLQAARDMLNKDIPLLGINLGHLGFLADIDRHSIYPALDKLLSDELEIENRMMLQGTVYRGDRILGRDAALNDIVISREGSLRVVNFKNFVNNEYLNSYNADGIILSSPTGSTGYSLSCGGPVVSPAASLTLMTPIAPHTMNTRSLVFSAEDVITVELGRRREETESGVVTFDGDTTIPITSGDRIVIQKSACSTRIIKLNHLSFVEVLRQRMRNS